MGGLIRQPKMPQGHSLVSHTLTLIQRDARSHRRSARLWCGGGRCAGGWPAQCPPAKACYEPSCGRPRRVRTHALPAAESACCRAASFPLAVRGLPLGDSCLADNRVEAADASDEAGVAAADLT